MRVGIVKIKTLVLICFLWISSCSKYSEPTLEKHSSWPAGFEYYSDQRESIQGCIDISGVYKPEGYKYTLDNDKVKFMEKGVMVLSSFFNVSKPVQVEMEINPNELDESIEPYYVVQNETGIEVSFYRFDGSKKYVSLLNKNKNYYCKDNTIILSKRYSRYGAEGTWINYKTYIEIKKIKDGLLIYENIANVGGNKHYYYQYQFVAAEDS